MSSSRIVAAVLAVALTGAAGAQVGSPSTGSQSTVRKTPSAPLAPAPAAQPVVLPSDFDRLRPVPVFWVIGQSNAEGDLSGFWLRLPPPTGPGRPDLTDQPDVKIWWPGNSSLRPNSPARWESYRTGEALLPVNNSAYHISEGAFGTEASLGDGMQRRLGEPVWIFKYTRVAALNPAAPSHWSKSSSAGSLYPAMLADWRRAADALRAQGLAPDVRGLFWLQGETDVEGTYVWASEYGTHLRRFISDLRTDLAGDTGVDDGPCRAPFVISALHPHHQPPGYWNPGEDRIRRAQREVAAKDPRAIYFETDELALDKNSGSWVHFDGHSMIRLGYDFVDAWWALARDR